ncbi:MAG: hypothetical protein WD118_10200 [Phycisphaeraceae bacterium]
MAAKASISSGYRWRLAVIAAALLLVGTAFVYDGWVTYGPLQSVRRSYPERKRIFEEFQAIQQQYADDSGEAARQWLALVESEGYPERPAEYSDRDIRVQKLLAALTLPLGAVFAVVFVLASRRWIASDEQGLHTSWGQRAPWDALRSVDKRRWKTKGIAVVHYDVAGVTKRLTLDDWKYEREPTAQLLGEVEARVGGGESASDPNTAGEAAARADASGGDASGGDDASAPAEADVRG